MSQVDRDQWAEWILHGRHGGDPEELQKILGYVHPVRDRILDKARVAVDDTVLDVGTGDGLIAFAALTRVGDRGEIIFSDISQDLLDHCKRLATEMGVVGRCRFVQAKAEDLTAIPDGSVDAVTARSVLIYVADKHRAFAEFFRVLRAGGRISLAEPIHNFNYGKSRYDVAPIQNLARRVRAVFEQIQPPATDPMLNFDEHDLLSCAEKAGFQIINLELTAEVRPVEPHSWEATLRTAGNPRLPALAEAIERALTADEAQRYEAHLRPLVERGQGVSRSALAYLWAVKA